MTNVMSLDLTGNNIENVPREYLTDMPRLRTLNLSDNQLEGVCDKFESETLKTLIIRRNRLVQLANNSFADLPALQKLDLSGTLRSVSSLLLKVVLAIYTSKLTIDLQLVVEAYFYG